MASQMSTFSDIGLSSQLGGGHSGRLGHNSSMHSDAGGSTVGRNGMGAGTGAASNNNRAAAHIGRFAEGIARVIDDTAEEVRKSFEEFMTNFQDEETNTNIYLEQIKHLSDNETATIYVDYMHLSNYNEILAETIRQQHYRMEPYLRKAVQNLVSIYAPSYVRIRTGGQAQEGGQSREFWLSWYGMNETKKLRALRMDCHSQLVTISGTVTRTSEVRPELLFGTFICNECGSLIKDVEQAFKYTEPATCFQTECGNRSDFTLSTESSKFVDWQKIRIQENADEVPGGAMPRSMDVILRNEIVERAKAGDKIIITGMPIVVPDVAQLIGNRVESRRENSGGRPEAGSKQDGITGLKALGVRELTYKLVFLASFVQPREMRNALNALHDINDENDPAAAVVAQFSVDQLDEIRLLQQDRRIYQKLASSIAPHIYGHEDVKKGILLQMLGGVHKKTIEGIRLRGDINVCIVGDPSTAKSQFLKYVSNFMPRAIYTSGKASSAAGLTASVVKDEETGEFTIEAGALMLADNGICCIDEFDKMDLVDQVAIHEAMEQQTISIAKAGIQATLNARTSILAAANPIHGRYDKKLSLKQNIAMSPPIMSRFDLFFVILDECHEQTDLCIAQHIINFHRFQEQGVQPEISTDRLKRYLTYARALKPKLTNEAMKYLVSQYRNLRQADATGVSRSSYRITVRQLESMIRLSEALAKLHCEPEILVRHVTEAAHLLKTSIVHVEQESVPLEDDDFPVSGIMRPTEVGEMPDMDTQSQSVSGALAEGMQSSQLASQQPTSAVPVKITLSQEEYQKIVQSILLQLRRQEHESSESGMTRSDLMNWYIEMLVDANTIETEDEIMHHRKLIKSVLSRLVKKENILMEIRDKTRLTEDSVDEQGAPLMDDPVLAINPAYYNAEDE